MTERKQLRIPTSIPAGMHWAFRTVEQGLRERPTRRIKDSLPARFSTPTLRFIRIHACRNAASRAVAAIDCAKWASSASSPELSTPEYVCDDCTHPRVTGAALIDRLGLASKNEDFSDRSWRRHINDGAAMTPEQLQRVVANALGQGWIGMLRAASLWEQIDQLAAMKRTIIAIRDRVRERKACRLHDEFEVLREEAVAEFEKQLLLIDRATTGSIDERLKSKVLPAEARALMAEVTCPLSPRH